MPTPTNPDATAEQVLSRMKDFNNYQSTRVALYKEFDDAFQEYLSGKCTPQSYHAICGIVTEGFQEVSSDIQMVENDMKGEFERKDFADMIRNLQELEKEKLRLTATYQMKKIDYVKTEGAREFEEELKDIEANLSKTIENINEKLAEIREAMADL